MPKKGRGTWTVCRFKRGGAWQERGLGQFADLRGGGGGVLGKKVGGVVFDVGLIP